MTVYAQKNLLDLPDQAELHDGVRVRRIGADRVIFTGEVGYAAPPPLLRTGRPCWPSGSGSC